MSNLMKTVEEISSSNGVRERYCDSEIERITNILSKGVPREDIKYRPAGGGQRVGYIEGYKAVEYCNDIFGFNGWSFSLVSSTVDVMDENNGAYTVGLSCLVQVTLKDGTFRQDIGYGSMENSKSKVAAFEKSKKEAVTDGLKRCLRLFGYRLGGCVYDKSFLSGKRESSTRHFAKSEPIESPIKLTNSNSFDSYRINHLPTCNQSLNIKIEHNQSKVQNLTSSSTYQQPASLVQPMSSTNFPSSSNVLNENAQNNNDLQTAATDNSLVKNYNIQNNQQNTSQPNPYNPFANKPTNTNTNLFANSSVMTNQVPTSSSTLSNSIYASSNKFGQPTLNQIKQVNNNVFANPGSINTNLPAANNNHSFGSNSNQSDNPNLNYLQSKDNMLQDIKTPLLCDVKDPVGGLILDGDDYDYDQLYGSTPDPSTSFEPLAPIPPSTSTSSNNTSQHRSYPRTPFNTTITNLPQSKFEEFKIVTDSNTGFTTFTGSNSPYAKPNQRYSPKLHNLRTRQGHKVGKSRENSKLANPSTSIDKNG